MHGYLVTFVTHERSRHQSMSVANWITREARELGAGGITINMPEGGVGHDDGRSHSVNNTEIGEQIVEVIIAMSHDTCDRLFAKMREEGLEVFYTRAAVEYGFTTDNPTA